MGWGFRPACRPQSTSMFVWKLDRMLDMVATLCKWPLLMLMTTSFANYFFCWLTLFPEKLLWASLWDNLNNLNNLSTIYSLVYYGFRSSPLLSKFNPNPLPMGPTLTPFLRKFHPKPLLWVPPQPPFLLMFHPNTLLLHTNPRLGPTQPPLGFQPNPFLGFRPNPYKLYKLYNLPRPPLAVGFLRNHRHCSVGNKPGQPCQKGAVPIH